MLCCESIAPYEKRRNEDARLSASSTPASTASRKTISFPALSSNARVNEYSVVREVDCAPAVCTRGVSECVVVGVGVGRWSQSGAAAHRIALSFHEKGSREGPSSSRSSRPSRASRPLQRARSRLRSAGARARTRGRASPTQPRSRSCSMRRRPCPRPRPRRHPRSHPRLPHPRPRPRPRPQSPRQSLRRRRHPRQLQAQARQRTDVPRGRAAAPPRRPRRGRRPLKNGAGGRTRLCRAVTQCRQRRSRRSRHSCQRPFSATGREEENVRHAASGQRIYFLQ